MTTNLQHPRRGPFGGRPLVRSAFAACLLVGGMAASMAAHPATLSPSEKAVAACQLDYQRADNMWAPYGVPKGSLGTETVLLALTQKKLFLTDWKYEKLRNDGTRFYGSHLRIATNRGSRPMRLTVRGMVGDIFNFSFRDVSVSLPVNASLQFQHDLVDVLCQ